MKTVECQRCLGSGEDPMHPGFPCGECFGAGTVDLDDQYEEGEAYA